MAARRKEIFIVLIAVSLVFISGCIEFGEQEEEVGYGVEITSFDAIPPEVFSGDSFDLLLDVRNMGDRTADDVWANIERSGGITNVEGFDDVMPLDPPTDEFQGEMHTFTASANAPQISIGPEDVNVRARVYYDYKTDSRVLLPVIGKDEYAMRLEVNDPIPEMGVSRMSRGPISVGIDGPSPVLVDEDDTTFRFYIEGRNIGGGVPYLTEAHGDVPDRDQRNRIGVDVSFPEDAPVSWEDEDCSDDDVRVYGGDFQIICRGEVDEPVDFLEVPIDVTLDYGYYVDGETTLTVKESI